MRAAASRIRSRLSEVGIVVGGIMGAYDSTCLQVMQVVTCLQQLFTCGGGATERTTRAPKTTRARHLVAWPASTLRQAREQSAAGGENRRWAWSRLRARYSEAAA